MILLKGEDKYEFKQDDADTNLYFRDLLVFGE